MFISVFMLTTISLGLLPALYVSIIHTSGGTGALRYFSLRYWFSRKKHKRYLEILEQLNKRSLKDPYCCLEHYLNAHRFLDSYQYKEAYKSFSEAGMFAEAAVKPKEKLVIKALTTRKGETIHLYGKVVKYYDKAPETYTDPVTKDICKKGANIPTVSYEGAYYMYDSFHYIP